MHTYMYNIRNFLYERRKSMKKMKLLGALALASCVMLSGCNKKPEEPSNPDPDPAIVINNLPEKVYVGSSFDLSQFVSLTSLSAFTFELDSASQDLVSVEGNVISILGEGEIKFTVKAGELSKECSVLGIRESRDKLIQYVNGVENNYTVNVYELGQVAGEDTESEDDDEYDFVLADMLVHTSKYLLSHTQWSYDQATQQPIPGGWLKFSADDTDLYKFTIGSEGEGTDEHEVVELGDQASPMLFDAYNGPLGLDFATMEYAFDSEAQLDSYVLKGDAAKQFAQNSLFMPGGKLYLQSGTYDFTKIEFSYENVASQEEPEYALVAYAYFLNTNDNKEYLWSINEFYVDEESVGLELLDEYCVPEHKPVVKDYWNYFNDYTLGELFFGPESLLGTDGVISLAYGWFDDEGKAISLPSDIDPESVFGALPVGSSQYLSSADSFWEYVPIIEDEAVVDVKPTHGKMTVTSAEPETSVLYDVYSIQNEPYYAAEEADEASVFEDLSLTFGHLRSQESWPSGIIASDKELDDGSVEFTFGASKSAPVLFSLIESCEGLKMLGTIINYLITQNLDISEWFDGTMTVDVEHKTVNITLGFLWDDGQNYLVMANFQANSSAAAKCATWSQQIKEAIFGN